VANWGCTTQEYNQQNNAPYCAVGQPALKWAPETSGGVTTSLLMPSQFLNHSRVDSFCTSVTYCKCSNNSRSRFTVSDPIKHLKFPCWYAYVVYHFTPISHLSHPRWGYITHPFHPPSLNNANHIQCRVQIVELFTLQTPATSSPLHRNTLLNILF
jgi:hypothetical protein